MCVDEFEHQLWHPSIEKHILPIFQAVVQLFVFDPKLLLFDLRWEAFDIFLWLRHGSLEYDRENRDESQLIINAMQLFKARAQILNQLYFGIIPINKI